MDPLAAPRALTMTVAPKLLETPAKRFFSKWMEAAPGRLHFAPHSHHPWPDASFEAQVQCWKDAATLADFKWDKIFGEVVPDAQCHVARLLKLSDPATVAFAPSTLELVMRAITALEGKGLAGGAPLRILTTDSEFHSFTRQSARLEEAGLALVHRVAVEPFETFRERFIERVRSDGAELNVIYVSHVFYNSGYFFDSLIEAIAAAEEAAPQALFFVDGYHSFMAMAVDWSSVEKRTFYLGGGYKYAMSGEGVCFMHCPPGWALHPVNTGWFAGFGDLTKGVAGKRVPYSNDGFRMWGATYDPVAVYRFRAVQELWQREGIDSSMIHAHARALQEIFLDAIPRGHELAEAELLPPRTAADRGNFLTFRTPRAGDLYASLRSRNVVTDYRMNRLRFGFGIAQTPEDVHALAEVLGRDTR
jgi:selenocysteine lyase/cysteine desulfurase